MKTQYHIHCPACDHEFDIEQAIATRVELGYQENLKQKEEELDKKYQEKLEALATKESLLKTQAEAQQKLIDEKVEAEKATLMQRLKEDVAKQFEDQLKFLQEENQEKSLLLKELRQRELQVARKEREIQSVQERIELEFEKKMIREREAIRQEVSEGFEQRKAIALEEKDILIRQLKERIDDMQRKTEQGSMQVQGEAQEIVIENALREYFPQDQIEEVKKGANGADCIQYVKNETGTICGSIVYESKRTKNFSAAWVKKLKEDTLKVKGKIPVLVSEALPDGVKGVCQIEGVWITDLAHLQLLVLILRRAIIREFEVLDHQVDKQDKMQLLYDYLVGTEFKMQVHAIVEGYEAMKINLDKQRRSMILHWKQQEKELERVIDSTIAFYGSIRGIAGTEVKSIEHLELLLDESAEMVLE